MSEEMHHKSTQLTFHRKLPPFCALQITPYMAICVFSNLSTNPILSIPYQLSIIKKDPTPSPPPLFVWESTISIHTVSFLWVCTHLLFMKKIDCLLFSQLDWIIPNFTAYVICYILYIITGIEFFVYSKLNLV
jgi:hypothetical protein